MKTFKHYISEQRKTFDGDSFFSEDILEKTKNPPPYDPNVRHPGFNPDHDKVVHMNPKDFLTVARNGHNEDKQKLVDNLVDKKIKFNEIPELHFKHFGDGHARVTGHEGRHRAKALVAAGITKMPVVLRQRYNDDVPPVTWKTTFDGEFPHTLHGESGHDEETNHHRNNKINFPVQDPRIEDK